MEILNDVFKSLRLNSEVLFHSKFCDQWIVDIDPLNLQVGFHVIAQGHCWLHSPELTMPVKLRERDLVLVLRKTPHYVTDSDQPPSDDVPRNVPSEDETAGELTSVICGKCEFFQNNWNPVLGALPDIMVFPTDDLSHPGLRSVVKLMLAESVSEKEGSQKMMDRLADIILMEAIQAYMLLTQVESGYLAALGDSKLSLALKGFHQRPALSWTVETLAEQAGMPPSEFTQRFKQKLDILPMEYLMSWRMLLAFEQVVSGNKPIKEIYESCGYHSDEAFEITFTNQFGLNPGHARRLAREQRAAAQA